MYGHAYGFLFRDTPESQGLKITMKKHPKSFKLMGNLAEKNALVTDKETVLYDGIVARGGKFAFYSLVFQVRSGISALSLLAMSIQWPPPL